MCGENGHPPSSLLRFLLRFNDQLVSAFHSLRFALAEILIKIKIN